MVTVIFWWQGPPPAGAPCVVCCFVAGETAHLSGECGLRGETALPLGLSSSFHRVTSGQFPGLAKMD